jgi:RNA polymerase sigma factor (sigma-70 family)
MRAHISGPPTPTPKHWFSTTHWSLVFSATDPGDANVHVALEQLCGRYWYPLYACIRRHGFDLTESEDLTQGFFEHLLRRDRLAQADPARGKFRTFLLAALQNFLHDQHDRTQRVKRGGLTQIISWDTADAEQRYLGEPRDEATPEVLFNRRWAMTTLTRVRERVRDEFHAAGKAPLHELLHAHSEGEELSYEEIARRLGTTESAVKSAAHHLRTTSVSERRSSCQLNHCRPVRTWRSRHNGRGHFAYCWPAEAEKVLRQL